MSGRTSAGVGIGLAIIVAALAVCAPSALADTTRAAWVAQVDPICQNGQAQEAVAAQPFVRAVRRGKKHHNRKTGKRIDRTFRNYFVQYGNIERAVNAQIATVPPAPDDVSLVQVWLRTRGEQLDLESRLFLGPGNTGKGLKGLGQVLNDFFDLIGQDYEAADLVRDFGFQYCTSRSPELQIIR